MNRSISSKRLRLSSSSSRNQLEQEKLPAPAVYHQVVNGVELDFIHFFEIKLYLTVKVKQFQAGCIENHFSEWASYTMDKYILRSFSGLSLEFSDNKQRHYHKRIELRFSSKNELFLANEDHKVRLELRDT